MAAVPASAQQRESGALPPLWGPVHLFSRLPLAGAKPGLPPPPTLSLEGTEGPTEGCSPVRVEGLPSEGREPF